MKSIISTFLVLIFSGTLIGCSSSTGQDTQELEREITSEQDERESRQSTRSDRSDDEWAEHRENFGERRSSKRSDSDVTEDWGKEDERDAFDFNFDALEDVETEEDLEEVFSELGKAMEELGEALTEGADVQSVDYDELKDVLPSRIRGFEKEQYSGDNVRVFGIDLSVYEETYESDRGNERLEITLVDMGSLANATLVGIDWLDIKIQSEHATGFERTTTINGYPAFEQCEQSGARETCSLHLLVEERFVVEIEGQGVTMNNVRDVLSDMDIAKLKRLKEYGI